MCNHILVIAILVAKFNGKETGICPLLRILDTSSPTGHQLYTEKILSESQKKVGTKKAGFSLEAHIGIYEVNPNCSVKHNNYTVIFITELMSEWPYTLYGVHSVRSQAKALWQIVG